MKQQGGFTLIELIVVIVILGILAATALPKFSGLSVDARAAKMQGVAASLRGAAAMAHGQSLAKQLIPASAITLEDGVTTVAMANYYPTGTASGIAVAIEGQGISSGVNATDSTWWDFYVDAGRTRCVVTYKPATATSGLNSVPTIDDTAVAAASAATECI